MHVINMLKLGAMGTQVELIATSTLFQVFIYQFMLLAKPPITTLENTHLL